MKDILIIGIIYLFSLILLTIVQFDGFMGQTWATISNLNKCTVGNLAEKENVNLFTWNPVNNVPGFEYQKTCFTYASSFSQGMCPTQVTPEMAAYGVVKTGSTRIPVLENISPNVERCLIQFGGPLMKIPTPTSGLISYVIPNWQPMQMIQIEAVQGWNASDNIIDYKVEQVAGELSFDIVFLSITSTGTMKLQLGNDNMGIANLLVKAKNNAGWSADGVQWKITINHPLPLPPTPPPLSKSIDLYNKNGKLLKTFADIGYYDFYTYFAYTGIDNMTTSITVGPNTAVKLYQHPGRSGKSAYYTTGSYTLGDGLYLDLSEIDLF